MDDKDTPRDFLELAARLRQIQQDSPEDFEAEAKSVGVHRRKAYYLVEVAKTFEALPVSPDRLREIGWTKLQTISPGLTKKNLEVRLLLAEQYPVHMLRRILEEGEDGGGDTKKRTVLLRLSPDDYAVFAEVLTKHGASPTGRGLKDQDIALMNALRKLQSVGD